MEEQLPQEVAKEGLSITKREREKINSKNIFLTIYKQQEVQWLTLAIGSNIGNISSWGVEACRLYAFLSSSMEILGLIPANRRGFPRNLGYMS